MSAKLSIIERANDLLPQLTPPGLPIGKTNNGVPIYKYNHRKHNRSIYQPHQGVKECARRVKTKCGMWYSPIKVKGV